MAGVFYWCTKGVDEKRGEEYTGTVISNKINCVNYDILRFPEKFVMDRVKLPTPGIYALNAIMGMGLVNAGYGAASQWDNVSFAPTAANLKNSFNLNWNEFYSNLDNPYIDFDMLSVSGWDNIAHSVGLLAIAGWVTMMVRSSLPGSQSKVA